MDRHRTHGQRLSAGLLAQERNAGVRQVPHVDQDGCTGEESFLIPDNHDHFCIEFISPSTNLFLLLFFSCLGVTNFEPVCMYCFMIADHIKIGTQ